MHGEVRIYIKNSFENPSDLGGNGKIILKQILKKQDLMMEN
jgi:hypothetical protein